jgi:hypothetical protein
MVALSQKIVVITVDYFQIYNQFSPPPTLSNQAKYQLMLAKCCIRR